MTLKSYIMTITGNSELSKEVLHKQINFICQDKESQESDSVYSGKNYGIILIKQMVKKCGVNIPKYIRSIEERFLSEADKDFLLMILESMIKGQKV